MGRRWLISALMLLSLGSMAFSSEYDNMGFDPSVTQFVSHWDQGILDDYNVCAHNDGNSIGTFSISTFSAQKVVKSIRAFDVTRGCKYRRYSSSRQDAISKYFQFTSPLSDDPISPYVVSCLESSVSQWVQNEFKKIIEDSSNIAVFASLFDYQNPAADNSSEACSYYEFFIYRASGTVLKLVFNHTD